MILLDFAAISCFFLVCLGILLGFRVILCDFERANYVQQQLCSNLSIVRSYLVRMCSSSCAAASGHTGKSPPSAWSSFYRFLPRHRLPYLSHTPIPHTPSHPLLAPALHCVRPKITEYQCYNCCSSHSHSPWLSPHVLVVTSPTTWMESPFNSLPKAAPYFTFLSSVSTTVSTSDAFDVS